MSAGFFCGTGKNQNSTFLIWGGGEEENRLKRCLKGCFTGVKWICLSVTEVNVSVGDTVGVVSMLKMLEVGARESNTSTVRLTLIVSLETVKHLRRERSLEKKGRDCLSQPHWMSFLKKHLEKATLIPRRVDRKLLMVSQRRPDRNLIQTESSHGFVITTRVSFRGCQFDGRVGVTRVTEK